MCCASLSLKGYCQHRHLFQLMLPPQTQPRCSVMVTPGNLFYSFQLLHRPLTPRHLHSSNTHISLLWSRPELQCQESPEVNWPRVNTDNSGSVQSTGGSDYIACHICLTHTDIRVCLTQLESGPGHWTDNCSCTGWTVYFSLSQNCTPLTAVHSYTLQL